MLTAIKTESERYASQKGVPFMVDINEIKVFMGILILSGYNPRPQRRLYWEGKDDVH